MMTRYVKRIDFAPHYWVSADGKIYKELKASIKEIKGWTCEKGYQRCRLYVPGHKPVQLRFQQIVAWMYCKQPLEGQWLVRHLDNNKKNNAWWNLRFGTALENSYDTYRRESA